MYQCAIWITGCVLIGALAEHLMLTWFLTTTERILICLTTILIVIFYGLLIRTA